MLLKSSSQSLTEQLSGRFAQRIRDRLLAPGARLPSVRLCAQQQGVSPSTVVAAYDQLLAQGLVEARKNRGFFVRELAQRQEPSEPAPPRDGREPARSPGPWATATGFATRPNAPIDAGTLIRGMFHKVSPKPQPGMGVFPPEWLESTFMPAAVRKVTSTRSLQAFSLQYGEPMGDSSLRQALSKKLATLNVPAAQMASSKVQPTGTATTKRIARGRPPLAARAVESVVLGPGEKLMAVQNASSAVSSAALIARSPVAVACGPL